MKGRAGEKNFLLGRSKFFNLKFCLNALKLRSLEKIQCDDLIVSMLGYLKLLVVSCKVSWLVVG